ncbi:hypothetical protein [Nocardioides daejeonensis]|uniref:hypothetical protein n=1 Tax=Nocardioides daejeonensis TaxID=1046556 RepID=UPI0013A5BD04|nr:hypothetical protein [Nocardioides daejeonensis]
MSLAGPGGRTVVQHARIAAGRSALLSFKVPRSWAAAAKTGEVKLRMTGTVKRPNGAQVTLRAVKLRLKRR